MSAHWTARYVGHPYSPGAGDCAALAAQVQAEVFGHAVALPVERAPGNRGLTAQIADLRADFADPVATPADGDAVLMRCRGKLLHVGVYADIGGEAHVLHAMRNAGQVCLHALRALDRLGLAVEGFYRWR